MAVGDNTQINTCTKACAEFGPTQELPGKDEFICSPLQQNMLDLSPEMCKSCFADPWSLPMVIGERGPTPGCIADMDNMQVVYTPPNDEAGLGCEDVMDPGTAKFCLCEVDPSTEEQG
eukprot:GHVO01050064.1.p1 GENE.GHVO01050064.1~~GHVO01050064.1.p1  ORF type:complete len:118 (+),score=23.33 GHVO01050064.1:76-429(+)